MINIAIFASGSGSNALNVIQYFAQHDSIQVSKVISNNAEAGALIHAKNEGIEAISFTREEFQDPDSTFSKSLNTIDFVVLAGFLWLVPIHLINKFEGKMLNIHPALLPKFGGKGMYGKNVHNAVAQQNESESGITIHLVTEKYDEGTIVAQFKAPISENDGPNGIEKKVRALEIEHFPSVIHNYIEKCITTNLV